MGQGEAGVGGHEAAGVANPYAPPRGEVGGAPGVYPIQVGILRLVPLLFNGLLAASFTAVGVGLFVEESRIGGARGWSQALTVISVGLVLGASVASSAAVLAASRGPAVRAFREGVEVAVRDPGPAAELRLLWAGLLGRGLRLPRARIPWDAMTGLAVTRRWMRRTLVIGFRPTAGADHVRIPRSALTVPARQVAEELAGFARDGASRAALPSWDDG